MNAPLSPIVSEFTTVEETDAYDGWFRAKVGAAMTDRRTSIPHAQVTAEMRDLIESKSQKSAVLIVWNPSAVVALREILDYVSDRNLEVPSALFEEIANAVTALAEHPYVYRLGRASSTREILVHPNYLAVYRVTDRAEVLNVLHSTHQFPN